MTAKILTARQFATGVIAVTVHLDTTKLLADGVTPDPAWVLRREWQVNVADWAARTGPQKTVWINAVKAEIVAACAAQLAVLNDAASGGTALAIEGQTFG